MDNAKIFERIAVEKVLLILVFVEHLFFFYFNNVLHRAELVDSIAYYNNIQEASFFQTLCDATPGSNFMVLVVYLFGFIFKNFTFLSLIFSLISFIPYYLLINNYTKKVLDADVFCKMTFLLLLFMPSMHLWITGIFKESVLFPALYGLLARVKKGFDPWNIILFIFIVFLRPYLGFILIIALAITNYRSFNIKKILLTMSGVLIFIVGFIKFIRSDLSIFTIKERLFDVYKYSQSGGSFIDLKETTYAERLVYMIFRPIFLDAHTKAQMIYSFENLVLAGWFLVFLYEIFKNSIKLKFLFQNIFIVTSLLIWLFIGTYIYNYGLASRMKVMIIPFLLVGAIGILKQQYHEKNS